MGNVLRPRQGDDPTPISQSCQPLSCPTKSTSKGRWRTVSWDFQESPAGSSLLQPGFGRQRLPEPVPLLSELQPSGPPARAHLTPACPHLSYLLTPSHLHRPPGPSVDATASMEAFPFRLLPTEDPAFTCARQCTALPTARDGRARHSPLLDSPTLPGSASPVTQSHLHRDVHSVSAPKVLMGPQSSALPTGGSVCPGQHRMAVSPPSR